MFERAKLQAACAAWPAEFLQLDAVNAAGQYCVLGFLLQQAGWPNPAIASAGHNPFTLRQRVQVAYGLSADQTIRLLCANDWLSRDGRDAAARTKAIVLEWLAAESTPIEPEASP